MVDFYGSNDLTFEYINGNIEAVGYNIISSSLLKIFEGGSKESKGKEEKECNMSVPIGLVNFNIKNKQPFNILNSGDILSDDLYDKLLNLINVDSKPIHNITKKNKVSSNNKSHKMNKT